MTNESEPVPTALLPISEDNPLCDEECGAVFEEIGYSLAHLLDHYQARGATLHVALSELEVHLTGWLDAWREDLP